MSEWHESVATREGSFMIISDVYRAMQGRLDAYRQGAGALLIGVVAAAVVVDSAVVRSLLNPDLLKKIPADPTRYYVITAIVMALIEVIAIVGWCLIREIGKYFAEMTSVVYKIDVANKMWEVNHWFKDENFYPNQFKTDVNVTRNAAVDPVLIGWHDPTIRWYRSFIIALFYSHLAFYLCVLLYIYFASSSR